MQLRPWHPADVAAVDSLLDPRPHPLWVAQFHPLHGPDREGPDWRRTVVATDTADRMVGCATVVANRLHPDRFPCAVQVAPGHRRRGVGATLLEAMRVARRGDRPLSAKIRAEDTVAQGFLASIGGRVYQRCPGAVIDPRDPAVRRWMSAQETRSCASLSGMDIADLAATFATQYEWVHASWSRVGDAGLLAAVSVEEVSAADLDISAGVWVEGRLAAAAFAFASGNGGGVEVVAETVRPDEPGGMRLVAGVVAAVLQRAAIRGGLVEFDGHVTDPHLHPVLAGLPWSRSNPVDLVTVP